MTNEEFIETVITYYHESREITIEAGAFNIWRGVSHSISSKTEDLLALFIAERLNDESLEFIVDKTFTMRQQDRSSITFRPDIAIVRDDQITHIIDLKMDMGYKRRYHETDSFNTLQNNFTRLRSLDFDTVSFDNETRIFTVSESIKNHIVVISEKNEGNINNRIDMINHISALDWVEIYYLSGDVHPNNYINATPTIRHANFDRLFNDIVHNL
jgi:hypothetical protein